MEYWKAFTNLTSLMENDFWKGDHVPPSTSAEPWLAYIYIVKIIPNNKITIKTYIDKNNEEKNLTDYFKIGFSNNDTNNVEISRRINELNSELGKVRLIYRWRLPAAQKYENSIKDFLINFRFKEKEVGCIQNDNSTNPKGFTEIIYNIPITTLVHTIQLCIIYHSLKNYLTDKSNSGALSIMTVSPTSIQDTQDEYTFRTTEEPNIVFNYTDVFNEIHRRGISFSIYPQRCLVWDWDGEPPEKFKEYIMNYRNNFEQKYDFQGGDGGNGLGDFGDFGGGNGGNGGGGVPTGGEEKGSLLPLVLYALRF